MDETDRWWRNAAIAVGFFLPLLFFLPFSCWDAECLPDAAPAACSGCDSLSLLAHRLLRTR